MVNADREPTEEPKVIESAEPADTKPRKRATKAPRAESMPAKRTETN